MIFLLIILLLISGFFSASETSFFNLKKHEKVNKKVKKLLDKPRELLTFILVGNTLANIAIGSLAASYTIHVVSEEFKNINLENLLFIEVIIVTLVILVFGEIIPKTLGATYWRTLAPVTAYFLKYLSLILMPFVKMSELMTKGFKEDSPFRGLSRSELHAMAELSGQEGQLANHEAAFLQSLLSLHELKIKDAITHRTALFKVCETMTVEEFFHKHANIEFSRIPVFEDKDSENITGFVMRSDLLVAQARGNTEKPLSEYAKDMVTVLNTMPLSVTFEHFINKHVHMLLVVDEYGGLEGVLTLEDLLERLLGVDIIDEKDTTVSMRRLAKMMTKRKEQMMIKNVPDASLENSSKKN